MLLPEITSSMMSLFEFAFLQTKQKTKLDKTKKLSHVSMNRQNFLSHFKKMCAQPGHLLICSQHVYIDLVILT